MTEKTDFSKVTPCGGDCELCGCFHDGGCAGCRETRDGECAIFKCCGEHGAYFCGVCWEFPCERITDKLSERDKNVYALKQLASEYRDKERK
ncbi:MAG: DUF3795 domain-containing protein [Lachnospiraceae bacterium]|nr:DUF3795 domain-containing protein [Ruminococcus sp.]MCM1274136.1 DUF3795 domain-containing protein [Lachnospiraceae bacterium]